jgi:hypothetical protein
MSVACGSPLTAGVSHLYRERRIMNLLLSRLLIFSHLLFIVLYSAMVMAEPPTQEDVNVYAALCKTGSLSKYDVSAEAGLISRRVLSGAAKLSAASLKDEFPGIKEEKNRLILIQGLQDCVYRYSSSRTALNCLNFNVLHFWFSQR